MSKKTATRLGRGLSSLLSIPSLEETREFADAPTLLETPDSSIESLDRRQIDLGLPEVGPRVLSISLDDVSPNPSQPRRSFDDTTLTQLANSLRTSGVVQPIIVRRVADNRYELIAGERRMRAARLAGLVEIPALLRQVDDAAQAELALVENVQREDLNPVDRARAYRDLMQKAGLTQQAIADRLGEDRSTVANHLRLLDLAQPVQEAVRAGKLSLGHAKLLAGLPDLLQQQKLASRVVADQLSVRQLEQMLSAAPIERVKKPDLQAHLADLEKQIAQQLGLRVQVRRGGRGKGRLVIHYGSLNQFDELLTRLAVEIPAS